MAAELTAWSLACAGMGGLAGMMLTWMWVGHPNEGGPTGGQRLPDNVRILRPERGTEQAATAASPRTADSPSLSERPGLSNRRYFSSDSSRPHSASRAPAG